MVTLAEPRTSNSSDLVDIATNVTESLEYVQLRTRGIRLEEALILLVVVCIWACAMFLFLRQWDNIRILQPWEPRFRHAPKNLDTIVIVKKPQDSIIYRNYSRKMSLTFIEREKRERKLLRMNTVPIMENIETLQHSFQTKLPTIKMEDSSTGEISNACSRENIV